MTPRGRRSAGPAFVLVLGGGYLLLTVWALSQLSYDVAGGLLLAPPVLYGLFVWARRTALADGDLGLAALVPAALALKTVGTIVRFLVIEVVYGGVADASGYYGHGVKIGDALRHGHFLSEHGRIVGTRALDIVTGVVFAVIGPTRLGGFIVFSALSFIGLFLWCRAYRLAVPNANHRRFNLLVLFMPSLLFWPSSIGKEAWMMGALGLLAWGSARMLRGRGGLISFAVATAAMLLIRPHIALAALGAFPIAWLFRRQERPTPLGPVIRVVGAAVFLVLTLVVVARVEAFLRVDTLDSESVDSVLTKNAQRFSTDQTGSGFASARPNSPADLPKATVTVLFRPFPTEAKNAQSLITSLEGVVLAVLIVRSRRVLTGLPRTALQSPWLLVSAGYALVFIYAFSSFSNFGLLARERVQVLPAIYALICAAVPPDRRGRRAEAAALVNGSGEPVFSA